MKVQPVGRNITIKIIETKKDTGIVLPDSVKIDKEIKAEVVALGSQCELGLKVGMNLVLKAGADRACIPVDNDEKIFLLPETYVIGYEVE